MVAIWLWLHHRQTKKWDRYSIIIWPIAGIVIEVTENFVYKNLPLAVVTAML